MKKKIESLEYRNERTALETVVPLIAPYIIYLDPCGACNFKCNFCPCNTSDYMRNERHKILSWDDFVLSMEQIKLFPEQIKVINLYANGEPLLNPMVCDMIKYIKDQNISREVRITTNGSLLNPATNQGLIDAGVDLVRISVESLYDDDYKKMCGIDFKTSDLIGNIEDLYNRSREKAKVSIKIITAAFRNDDDIQHFIDIYDPISDYRIIQRLLRDMWSEFDDIITCGGGSAYITTENRVAEGHSICSMPLTTMTIHSNGMVGVCPMDWKFGTKYGDIHEQTLPEMWNSRKLKELRLQHLRGKRNEIPYCRGCKCVGDDQIDDVAADIIERLL